MAFLAHILQVFTGFLGPLVILCIRQNSRFVKFHALQSIVWQVCYLVFFLGGFMFFFFLLFASVFHDVSRHTNTVPAFFLFFPLLWLFAVGGWITNVILGIVYGIKAQRGEWARYPIIGRWCLGKSTPASPLAPQS
jgi:uncharacterized Tic20 family protein